MKKELQEIIFNTIKDLGYKIDSINISVSSRPDLCDFQCNDLFKLSKINNKNIEELSSEIIDKLQTFSKYNYYFKNVEFVKPGFLNISISDEYITDNIKHMLKSDKFGIDLSNDKETYVLDYGGPNVAKPLHVGHMRTAIVGESIKRIIEYKGNKTISDVHLGDYGLQIGEVIYGILEENKNPEDIDIKYLDYIYPYMSSRVKEDENLKEKCATITKELQDGNEEYKKLWKK